nr:uncharacterized protein LOC117277633 [Nicotiana tomentosiformis]
MGGQKQMKEQNDRIEQIPGVPPVIKGVDIDIYSQQPCKPSATPLHIPKKFKMPDIPKYDGTTDPRDHVTALTTGVKDLFIKVHSGAQKVEQRMEDIFKVKQGDTELLREFVDRFQREKMMLPQVLDNWAAMAFASNLNKKISEATRRLKESLREFSTTTWNDVYNRYNTKLQIEEDIVARSRVDERTKSRRSRNRDAGSSSRFRKERDACDRDTNTNARIGDYSFNISTSELVAILRSMGDKVRWTKEMRSNPGRRSPDFWCEFHNDHGHKTADCRLLQGEVEHLLKQGYLSDLFSEKGKQYYMKNRQEPPKPPSPK